MKGEVCFPSISNNSKRLKSTLTVNSFLQKLSFSSLHFSLFLRLLVVIAQKVKYSMDNQ